MAHTIEDHLGMQQRQGVPLKVRAGGVRWSHADHRRRCGSFVTSGPWHEVTHCVRWSVSFVLHDLCSL